ncbi:MAG: heavy metal-associated domain-containing protein, partial [Patescibacteria group bacterium]
MKTIEFTIIGMDCPSCVVNIENVLKRNKNIHSVSINFYSGKSVIETNEKLNNEEIRQAIEGLGYKVNFEQKNNEHKHKTEKNNTTEEHHDHHKIAKESEIKILWQKFIIGAILSVFVLALSVS